MRSLKEAPGFSREGGCQPHPAALTPEQIAFALCEALHLTQGWALREIATAIRSAVMAERERCAKLAEWDGALPGTVARIRDGYDVQAAVRAMLAAELGDTQ